MIYPEIEITKTDLQKVIYFILMKFKVDSLHRQGTSSKNDLIGAFIERWSNKIAETIIFDKLLEGKGYRVVPDYFLYANDTDKNAPDVLGLEKNKKVIPFVRFNNGTWETIEGMPRVEVKVFRKDQALVGVRESQMIDDYYVIVESDLESDYLTAIFEKSVFSDEIFESLSTNRDFVVNDLNKQIIEHIKVKPVERIGTMRLLGTYSKDEFRKNSVLCPEGINPYYFGGIVAKSPSCVLMGNDNLEINNDGSFIYKYDDSYVCLPMSLESSESAQIKLLKKNKGSFYISTDKNIVICGEGVQAGDCMVELKKFDRSSKWNENIALKQALQKNAKDATSDLVKIFDTIAKNN